jgi:hypothetical protein
MYGEMFPDAAASPHPEAPAYSDSSSYTSADSVLAATYSGAAPIIDRMAERRKLAKPALIL